MYTAAIAAYSTRVAAQAPIEDVTPPTITMPLTGSYTTASVTVVIQFSDYSFDPASMVETVNGVSFTSAFNFVLGPLCPPKTQCLRTATATGTIGLTAGANTFHVELCDNDGNCGAKDAHYTYTPPPPLQLLTVSPTYQLIDVERGYAYNEVFTLYNGSTITNSYTVTRSCSSTVVASGCTPSTSTKTIAAGLSDTAMISFVAKSAPGAVGQLILRAKLTSDTTVRDSGLIDVQIESVETPGVVVANVNPGESVDRGLCLTISLHSGAYECGDLRLDYGLPTVRTMEKERSPTFIYSNQLAHPIERVAAEITLPNDGRIPDSVTAKLLVTRAGSPVQVDAEKWTGSDWTVGSTRRVVLSYDAIGDSTGLYSYSIQVGRWYGTTLESNSVASDLVVVNRSTSPFGAGWWLAGLERIISLPGNKWLWIGGDGSTRLFANTSVNLWVAGNVDRRERLEYDGTYYCRRLLHHACVLFNAQGQHVQTRNRLGEVIPTLDRTNFVYAGNLLTSIQLPVPSGTLNYTFAYDTVSGKPRLLRVTAPPRGATTRVTTATITSGQLLSLTYNAHPPVQFGYDGTLLNRILSVTSPRGAIEKYSFGALNTLASASLGLGPLATDTIRYTFSPAEIKGIGGSGNRAVTHGSATTKYDGPRTDVADTQNFWLDRFGEPTIVRDALGNETVLTRADPNYPALVTQVHLANGGISTAIYDTVGHVMTSTAVNPLGDGLNATTTNTWNMKFDFVATTTSPTGLLTTFGYDTLTGNRIWQYPGTDPARKVLFQYGNTLLQLSSTQLPGYLITDRDSVIYGALGNAIVTRSPKSFVDSLYENSIGEDTLTSAPIKFLATDTARVRTHSWLDDRGLDTLTVTDGSGIEWQTVRTHHDQNGNADSVASKSTPDLNAIGWIVHLFSFDTADRKVSDHLAGGETHTWVYDLAGNQLNGGARGGNAVSNSYNALNQLITRKASDTATFTYDEVGAMTSADNATARVSRTYYPGGALRSDTLRVSTMVRSDADFTKHIYGLSYRYDLDGRRVWMTHPFIGSILFSSNDSTNYGYDPVIGQLALVRDPANNRFTFAYDLVGRLSQQVARSGTADSTVTRSSYDSESNHTRLGADSSRYDARGKMYIIGDSLLYKPLGALSYRMGFDGLEENYTADAEGNMYYQSAVGGGIPVSQPTWGFFWPGSGQLVREQRADGLATDTTNYVYNGLTGSLLSKDVMKYAGMIDTHHYRWEHHTTLNSYDLQDQLIGTRYTVDTIPLSAGHEATDYFATEEYRYDALGRRVWMRTVRGPNCIRQDKSSGCRSNLKRTVWDGNQILYEIQVPGDTGFVDMDNDTYVSHPYYGTVAYTHGVGLDEPLAIYKDTKSVMVAPILDLSGRFIDGVCHPTACDPLTIFWPQAEGSSFSVLAQSPTGPPSWYGSIIEGQQDGSGMQYKRNRYYDPQSGRFTQEDPIGLAGGLNVYGFANGDPINFADPFGLCFDPISCAVAVAAETHAVVATSSALALTTVNLASQAVVGAAGIAATAAESRIFSVYQSVTEGKNYYGMSKNLAQRNSQHENGPQKMSIRALISNLTKEEARGAEQVLIESKGLQKDGGTLLNKINSIAKSNKKYDELTALGRKILESANASPQQD